LGVEKEKIQLFLITAMEMYQEVLSERFYRIVKDSDRKSATEVFEIILCPLSVLLKNIIIKGQTNSKIQIFIQNFTKLSIDTLTNCLKRRIVDDYMIALYRKKEYEITEYNAESEILSTI
jgi:triosephosphate isomerase